MWAFQLSKCSSQCVWKKWLTIVYATARHDITQLGNVGGIPSFSAWSYIHTYIHKYIHTGIHTIHPYLHTYIHTYNTYLHTYIHTYIQYLHTLPTYIHTYNTYLHTYYMHTIDQRLCDVWLKCSYKCAHLTWLYMLGVPSLTLCGVFSKQTIAQNYWN